MDWGVVEPPPEIFAVERITERFGTARERNEERRREADRPAPLRDWQGIILDMFI